jgi:hypothetical protein
VAMPLELECHIAQDLLVSYVAGEVSPQTLDWMNGHLSRCDSCRTALAALTDMAGAVAAQAPVDPASPDPGRKLVGRMRRTIWLVIAGVILMLGITAGSVLFGIQAIQKASGFDVAHPAPVAGVTPEQVLADLDLSRFALASDPLRQRQNGTGQAELRYADHSGNPVIVQAVRLDSVSHAHDRFEAWFNGFHTRILSVETSFGNRAMAKFRSQGNYWYAWQTDRWMFVIAVDQRVKDPAALRDMIRSDLFEAIDQAGQQNR